MKRIGLLIVGVLLVASLSGRAGQTDGWKVVCGADEAAEPAACHVAFVAQDSRAGGWVAVAVQVMDGTHEVQVMSRVGHFSSAEIDVIADTTIQTDFCYDTYCVFVQADELIDQFKKKVRADIRLYNGTSTPTVDQRVSLIGFTRAYEDYLKRIGG